MVVLEYSRTILIDTIKENGRTFEKVLFYGNDTVSGHLFIPVIVCVFVNRTITTIMYLLYLP